MTGIQLVRYLSWVLLVGVPAFDVLVWRPFLRGHVDSSVLRRTERWMRAVLVLGALGLTGAALANVARIVLEFEGVFVWDRFLQLLLQSQLGNWTLYTAGLVWAWVFFTRLPHHAVVRAVQGVVLVALTAVMALPTHTGSKGSLLLTAIDGSHLLATGVWVGILFHVALLPWSTVSRRWPPAFKVGAMVQRLADIGVYAVTILGATGYLMSRLHLFGLPALTGTPYGVSLLWKLGFVGSVLGVAAVNHFYFRPAFRRAEDVPGAYARSSPLLARFAYAVRAESVLLLAVLAATSSLTVTPPPQQPVGLTAPVSLSQSAGNLQVQLDIASSADGTSTLDITVAEGARPVDGAQVSVELSMPAHPMGTQEVTAEPLGGGRYRARVVLAMSGEWQARLHISAGDGDPRELIFLFQADSGLLERDMVPHLMPEVAFRSARTARSFLTGVAVILAASFMLGVGVRYESVRWLVPAGAAVILAVGTLIAPLIVVYGYPTTYTINPVPYTIEVVRAGRVLYEQHCQVCHGPEGRGDGPQAAQLMPRPADLSHFHVDTHTDGDLFWWISNGMPGTAMPPFQYTLSEEERWTLVRYIRSLRMPPPPGAEAAL